MIYWAQFLHFYQPPTQSPHVLDKICRESYRPLIKILRQHSIAKVTVNVNGVLTEMLHDCGHDDIIDGLKQLAEAGRIEFTGSGKYHPIMPLIPQREMERQIKLNRKTNAHFFGDLYQPSGFFLPEMCYDTEVISPVLNDGHRWIILSGVACPTSWPVDVIHYINRGDKRLEVFFRDDIVSNKISFEALGPLEFLSNLVRIKENKEKIYVVTAMDAETFGHHIKHWEELFLAPVYDQIHFSKQTFDKEKRTAESDYGCGHFHENSLIAEMVQCVTVSQLLDIFPVGEAVEPKSSSWSTSGDDLTADNPYPLWMDKDNEIHHLQWEHVGMCLELVDKANEVCDNDESKHFANIARGLLDEALHSCQFWWASQRPMFDVNLVHKGLQEQWQAIVNAYRAINLSQASEKVKKECYYKLVAARDLRDQIIDRLFL